LTVENLQDWNLCVRGNALLNRLQKAARVIHWRIAILGVLL